MLTWYIASNENLHIVIMEIQLINCVITFTMILFCTKHCEYVNYNGSYMEQFFFINEML